MLGWIFVAVVFVNVKVVQITVENLNTEKSATQFYYHPEEIALKFLEDFLKHFKQHSVLNTRIALDKT